MLTGELKMLNLCRNRKPRDLGASGVIVSKGNLYPYEHSSEGKL